MKSNAGHEDEKNASFFEKEAAFSSSSFFVVS